MHFLLFIFSLFFSVPSPGFFPDFFLRFFSFFCFYDMMLKTIEEFILFLTQTDTGWKLCLHRK